MTFIDFTMTDYLQLIFKNLTRIHRQGVFKYILTEKILDKIGRIMYSVFLVMHDFQRRFYSFLC